MVYIKSEENSQIGILHMATFQISETENVVGILKALFCDVMKPGDVISVTGLSSEKIKSHIEEVLDIR